MLIKNVVNRMKPDMLRILMNYKTNNQVINDTQSFFGGKEVITKSDLIEFFTDLGNIIPGEEYFINVLEKTWGVKELQTQFIKKENFDDFLKNFRIKVINAAKGKDDDEFVLRRMFDNHKTGLMGFNDFKGILKKIDFNIDDSLQKKIFCYLDRDKKGLIQFEEFLKIIFYHN